MHYNGVYAHFGTSGRDFDALHIYLCAFGLFDARFSTGRSPEKSLSFYIGLHGGIMF